MHESFKQVYIDLDLRTLIQASAPMYSYQFGSNICSFSKYLLHAEFTLFTSEFTVNLSHELIFK